MNFKITIKNFRFFIGFSWSHKVRGVHSLLPDGKHILMWDLDDVSKEDVIRYLREVQSRFKLPKIYLLNTGLENYWHAWCLKKVDWGDALRIVVSTPGVDKFWFTLAVARGYFTLRYTPKKNRQFKPAIILNSKQEEDLSPFDLTYFSEYWTKRV